MSELFEDEPYVYPKRTDQEILSLTKENILDIEKEYREWDSVPTKYLQALILEAKENILRREKKLSKKLEYSSRKY